MKRRTALAAVATGGLSLVAGCLGRLPLVGSSVQTEFELVDPELEVEDDPDVRVDDDTVTVLGTVEYASSECGTVDLAHAEYEASQDRLDVLVVAADDGGGLGGCTDDIVQTGYRLEAAVDGRLRRVSATEHHVFGDTYSTSVDGLDR
ncbi:hypothetical protein [Natronorubrum tibetense]|uniref:Lipoprotein n=1 Tax=Natronorubrum tibetense GA33 TaxID=1114856 RepID=L9W8J6_9EURY|nr:hypothetical protein [Natronorubrum tibetense]ELY45566.1 hypothetical protein C496_04058 [Natronorubrum tibetense GA33]